MSPYIKKERRSEIDTEIIKGQVKTPGELNYKLTQEILNYLPDKPRYQDYNEVMGVIECLKMELYRKKIATYEDEKCKLNGEVY